MRNTTGGTGAEGDGGAFGRDHRQDGQFRVDTVQECAGPRAGRHDHPAGPELALAGGELVRVAVGAQPADRGALHVRQAGAVKRTSRIPPSGRPAAKEALPGGWTFPRKALITLRP